MKKLSLVSAIICFALAAVIFLFGDGLRVIYSGGFFALMGVVMLINSRRAWKRKSS